MLLLLWKQAGAVFIPEDLILTTITGSIYNASTGLKCTAGRLVIYPQSFLTNSTYLLSASPVVVDVPLDGNLSFQLAASREGFYSGGVRYVVVFDPDPADTITPITLKEGYFTNVWTVPDVTSIGIHEL